MEAILLTIVGTLLLVFAISGAIRLKLSMETPPPPELGAIPLCRLPSPDGSVHCNNSIEHLGWCSHNGQEWSGNSWNCDHWAETGAAPTAQAQEEHTELAYSAADDTKLAEPTTTTEPPKPGPGLILKPWFKSFDPPRVRWLGVLVTFWVVAGAVNGIQALTAPDGPDMTQFPHSCYHANGDRKDGVTDIIELGGTERFNECRDKLGWWGPLGTDSRANEQTKPFS